MIEDECVILGKVFPNPATLKNHHVGRAGIDNLKIRSA
jgi:hypothetical protein